MPSINQPYQWSINTCEADNVGYSQSYRNQQTVGGITYYDCSSFIWYALKAGGFDVESAYYTATGEQYSGNAIWTAVEEAWLQALGFEQKSITGEWLAGDILWRSGHTEMVYSGGAGEGVTMGAHSAKRELADQVSINSSTSSASSWTHIWRYGSGGASTYGYSKYVISAICGNLMITSGVNPQKTNGGYYGLFQLFGDRLTDFYQWCDSNGYNYYDGDHQIEYMISEGYWIQNYGEFSTLSEFLNSDSTDIAYLTECFERNYILNANPQITERITQATLIYQYITQHGSDNSIRTWIHSAGTISYASGLNNSVLIYRLLGAGGGGGGSIVSDSMPVWMMLKHF